MPNDPRNNRRPPLIEWNINYRLLADAHRDLNESHNATDALESIQRIQYYSRQCANTLARLKAEAMLETATQKG